MQRLKTLRQKHGYTQKELAEICGIDWRLLSKYERGECKPKIILLKLLARVLECSVDDLVSDI